MCDYSLMSFPNRLANDGEILVTHRFCTGSIGFVSPRELCKAQHAAPPAAVVGLWSILKAWWAEQAPRSAVPAVCIPPGARLKVRLIPERVVGIFTAAPDEEIVFTQITVAWGQFRDALRTKRYQEILLQAVGEGLEVQVVSLSLAEEVRPAREEYSYSLAPHR